MLPHALHLLRQQRLAISRRPFNARGGKMQRCDRCMLREIYCICGVSHRTPCNAAVLLLMYDDEILKPSNTGRLIADVIADTSGYIWARNEPNEELLAKISDPQYQPFLVFPDEYAKPEQPVVHQVAVAAGKTPLFILIDGSWREARKIFSKSPYLHHLPMLSICPKTLSRYQMRVAAKENHLATAEVAAMVLELADCPHAADALNERFDLFKERYLAGKMSREPKF
ncbi:hypothetical protein VST7929_01540 [Vibrio stylophorae]|uniref:tRNA-uridine aminocarboxypropyltransferase n=1 Tax=Vibrio stylophorae TaxID=659351 RepID=A0ABM8ZTM2_9VIBR|nr:tRNA-uridine aminocarboxypropyltransferase [Vibrio stylophorae]CAH0533669.1 hypothetical protein VST7929_01540 [Vibrio stylophorae]